MVNRYDYVSGSKLTCRNEARKRRRFYIIILPLSVQIFKLFFYRSLRCYAVGAYLSLPSIMQAHKYQKLLFSKGKL